MIIFLITVFQYSAIGIFCILTILEVYKTPVNYNDVMMNFALMLLYIIIYLKPFK